MLNSTPNQGQRQGGETFVKNRKIILLRLLTASPLLSEVGTLLPGVVYAESFTEPGNFQGR